MSKEIKLEAPGEICQGCLSHGRSLKRLGAYSEIFYTLLGNNTGSHFVVGADMMKMCWECIAKLDRVQQFRIQLCQAQNRLMEMHYMNTNITSLSGLSKTIKKVYDYEYNHKPIEDNIFYVRPGVEVEVDILETEPHNVSSIKLEKLFDNEKISSNEENCTDYTDNFNDEIPTKCTDTIQKTEKNKKHSNSIKKVQEKNKNMKKDVNRGYKNRTYREYVIVKTLNVNFAEDTTKYFDKVYLNETEVEDYVSKKEREEHRSFKHRCKECTLGFMATADLYRHQNFEHHKPGSRYKCRLCNKIQPTLDALKDHWKFTHSKFYVCKLCNAYVRVKCQSKHLKLQHMKKYCCTGCKLEFQTFMAFSAHYRKEHGKFICDYCDKSCHQKSVLIRHINTNHRIYKCLICVKSFKKKKYQSHLKHLHPEMLREKVDKESAYCVECNRQYPSVLTFKRHLKESARHTPTVYKRKACPDCGKLVLSNLMRKHINYHHRKSTNYYCEECDKYFYSNFSLKIHIRYVHLKEEKPRDKICDFCGQGFMTKKTLQQHRLRHTGERPHSCNYCPATFVQKYAWKVHETKKHGAIQEKKQNKRNDSF